MGLYLTTTGTLDPVVVDDLGARSFPHPTVDFDLLEEFTEDEVQFSRDLQALIDAGHITIKDDEGDFVTIIQDAGPHKHSIGDLFDLTQFTDMQEPTGFINRTDSTLAFDDGTRTFTIAPTVSQFEYYLKGVRYTKTTPQTKVISIDEGLHYLYFDGDALVETTTFDAVLIYEKALCAIIYWDAANSKQIYFADERHGVTMDGKTHAYLHFTRGTAWISGLAGDGIIADGTGDSDTHAYIGYTAGEIADEDLYFQISADAAPAQIPVYYKEGATGIWRVFDPTNFPVRTYLGTPGNRLAYNQWTGTIWQQTEVANNGFVLSHFFATNDVNRPVIAIQGENEYTSLPAAREGATEELNNLVLSGFMAVELSPLGTVVYQTSDGYANTPKARIRLTDLGDTYVDFREFTLASTGNVNDHGNLSGLGDDDHFQYMAMGRSGDVTGLVNEPAPGGTDVLLMERASDGAKRKVPVSAVGGGSSGPPTVIQGSEDTQDDTTSASWVQAWRFSPTLEVAKYVLWFSSEIVSGNGTDKVHAKLELDDATVISQVAYEPEDLEYNEWLTFAGIYFLNNTVAGPHNFDFDIFSQNGGNTASIRRKRIVLMKVEE